MTAPFLHLEGVSRNFGNVAAVSNFDLELEQGEMLALLGPSGCGKTTLLRLIAGFERPDAGTITLGGRHLASPTRSLAPDKRRVGLVFQDYALFPHLNVAANVTFGMPRGPARRARLSAMLETVGLAGLGHRMPNELSGGQQQRVALARTLASEPELVLLDEPFSNLDPSLRARVRSEVWQILKDLGTTAIFVTHDQEEALSLPGKVGVMLDGRLQQYGAASDIYRDPINREVAAFIGDANFLPGEKHGFRVSCELGTVAAFDEGEGPVEILVRPEDLAISSAGGTAATIVAAEYYGHDQLLTTRLPSGTELKMRLYKGERLLPGAQVGVRVAGDVVVFPRVATGEPESGP